ncbi:serine/threonine-protein phosphatase 4 regulatory subunit 2-A [Electrophorus electricus]|uniref:Serine/threonine-protein phosphatase 4 regulatory subunit 2 n=1 Tax=Electrophorus electricus TaxID=8005 RepID=A0A4W4F1F8_ELEEL|nr:serine/threonine-protein phosphatase 4 regulatory subunit 2-A [Electrophorus electricus]
MEIDSLLGAFRDFEKKGKKETCPILDQFLCHIAKTGETMIQWSQFKSYFLFKLEKVMDDFKASSPEQRGPANPNVEYIPFEEMKERILKIVDGYSGIPFTIQRLCELLTEPKRNYTGTDKFLRGVEKNVMVVSCVYPTSEKNGSTCMNRMNGVMFLGNASAFPDRNVNGPGTPRPVNRPKLSLSNSVASNGLPDSTENKEQGLELTERTVDDPVRPDAASLGRAPKKSKHRGEKEEEPEDEEARHDAKRLKFDDGEEETRDEAGSTGLPCVSPAGSPSDSPQPVPCDSPETEDTHTVCSDEQEPSSTQSESVDDGGSQSEMEHSPGPAQSQDSACESDPSEQHSQPVGEEPTEKQEAEEKLDPVSSSSSEEAASTMEPVQASPCSSTEPTAEGSSSAGNSSASPETADDTMEQE